MSRRAAERQKKRREQDSKAKAERLETQRCWAGAERRWGGETVQREEHQGRERAVRVEEAGSLPGESILLADLLQ